MKLDVRNLTDSDLREFIHNDELLFEEEKQLERQDIKTKKKKIQHKNIKRIMRS